MTDRREEHAGRSLSSLQNYQVSEAYGDKKAEKLQHRRMLALVAPGLPVFLPGRSEALLERDR